jgi:hypothetical protein
LAGSKKCKLPILFAHLKPAATLLMKAYGGVIPEFKQKEKRLIANCRLCTVCSPHDAGTRQ